MSLVSQKKVIKKDIYIQKYRPANKANQANSNCSLILTEGDSAASLFNQFPSQFNGNFYDDYGLLPLRGKILNTYNKKDAFTIDNKEIQNIIQIIGFQKGVHYNQQNLQNLRYKSIIIASDYDDDGFHIKGLILNFFLQYWPELIQLNFFKQFTTPIIVAKNKTTHNIDEFYQEQDFRDFQQNYSEVKYLKGLGSIDKRMPLFSNICNNFNHYNKFIIINQADKLYDQLLLEQLFNNNSINRKEFILNYVPQKIDHTKESIQLKDILQQQVVQYSFKTLERAIPALMDGLKDSQRKIIYHALNNLKQQIKVINFAADVSKTYDYHHGEGSLSGAIEQLAQSCVSTNNYPLLEGIGQFGNNWNPQDIAADRYIYISQSDYLKKFIRQEDKFLYKYRLSDDGKEIEPLQLYPIVPLFLLNGVNGIASGWSSFIPCFKLQNIIQYIKEYLLYGRSQIILNPYYKDYQGKTYFNFIDNQQYFISEGLYKEDQTHYYIYETCIDNGMSKAKMYDALQQQKIFPQRIGKQDIIKIKKQDLIKQNISFDDIYQKYLYSKKKCTNMTLLQYDELQNKIIPIIFQNIYTLLNYWIDMRLYYYTLRKQKLLLQLMEQYILYYNYQLVIDKQILKEYYNQEKTYQQLFYLTPFSKIKQLIINNTFKIYSNTIKDIQNYLIQQSNIQQSNNKKEYDYIMNKSVKFFVNKEFNLEEIEKQFINLYNTSSKDIWINELIDCEKLM